jgi:hypothetical protein
VLATRSFEEGDALYQVMETRPFASSWRSKHAVTVRGRVASMPSTSGAVDIRHLDVHQHDIRAGPAGELDRPAAVRCLADDLDVAGVWQPGV